MKRLQKELIEMNTSLENCSAGLKNDNIFEWSGIILGPKDSVYEEGIFNLDIVFPTDYPFKPPKIHFVTKIYHLYMDRLDLVVGFRYFHLLHQKHSK